MTYLLWQTYITCLLWALVWYRTYILWTLVWCKTYLLWALVCVRLTYCGHWCDIHLPTVGTGDVIHTARPRLLLFLSQWLSEGQGDWEHGSSTRSEMTGKYMSVLGYIAHGWAAVSRLSSKDFRLYGDGSRDRIQSVTLSHITSLPALANCLNFVWKWSIQKQFISHGCVTAPA